MTSKKLRLWRVGFICCISSKCGRTLSSVPESQPVSLISVSTVTVTSLFSVWMLLFSTFWDLEDLFQTHWQLSLIHIMLSIAGDISSQRVTSQFCCNSFLIEDNFFGNECNSGCIQSPLRALCVFVCCGLITLDYWEWTCGGGARLALCTRLQSSD